MPSKLTVWLAAGLLLALAAACSEDNNRPRQDGSPGDGVRRTDRPPAPTMTWTKTLVDPADAGKHASLAVSGSKVGVAYYRVLKDMVTVSCPPSLLDPGGPKARPGLDLMYAESSSGSDFGAPVKVDQTIGNTAGLSMAYSKSGKAFVGYLGGALNETECSSGDAMIASASDGKTFSKRTVLAAGPVGDTVGYWMAVATDSKGTDHAAYGDVRFSYYEVEGRQKASARYDANDVIAASNGAGLFNALVFDSSDNPIVVFFNPEQTGPAGGIQLAFKRGGTWETHQLVGGATKEKMGLAISSAGVLGVSYYEPNKQQVKYLESDKSDYKKTPWTEQLVDDEAGHAGEFSSIAYDSKGNPGVSYYKCGPYDPKASTCDFTKDGLRFAWRKDGVNWSVYDVPDNDPYECGTYTSLAFVNDQPVIAYRCVTLDSTTKEFKGALKVARGTAK